jgi:dTDP-4-amino-4,6-dideoxygalactose transaminase
MDSVLAIAQRHGLRVLEDACQAWGAAWRGRRVGTLGDLGAFSFQASKNITAGEGGIVITNDPDLAEIGWSLHNVGRTRTGAWYHHERLGANLRLSEWEGAILLAQLERLPQHIPLREANARYLAQALAAVEGITPLPDDPRVTQHARHLFIFRYDDRWFGGRPRDEFIAALKAEGIYPCSAGYVPLYRQPAIQRALGDPGDPTRYPVTEQAALDVVWLNQTVLLGDRADQDSIVAAILKIQKAWDTDEHG